MSCCKIGLLMLNAVCLKMLPFSWFLLDDSTSVPTQVPAPTSHRGSDRRWCWRSEWFLKDSDIYFPWNAVHSSYSISKHGCKHECIKLQLRIKLPCAIFFLLLQHLILIYSAFTFRLHSSKLTIILLQKASETTMTRKYTSVFFCSCLCLGGMILAWNVCGRVFLKTLIQLFSSSTTCTGNFAYVKMSE